MRFERPAEFGAPAGAATPAATPAPMPTPAAMPTPAPANTACWSASNLGKHVLAALQAPSNTGVARWFGLNQQKQTTGEFSRTAWLAAMVAASGHYFCCENVNLPSGDRGSISAREGHIRYICKRETAFLARKCAPDCFYSDRPDDTPATSDFPTASALAGALCTGLVRIRVRSAEMCRLLNKLSQIPPTTTNKTQSAKMSQARMFARAFEHVALDPVDGGLLVGVAALVEVLPENDPVLVAARACQYPAGALASRYWLSDCAGDQHVAGFIALAAVFDPCADYARARARVHAYANNPNNPNNQVSQVYASVLAELEILWREWRARTAGAKQACIDSTAAAKFLDTPSPDPDSLQRLFSIAVAAELFENCCRRQNHAGNNADACEHLVLATVLRPVLYLGPH